MRPLLVALVVACALPAAVAAADSPSKVLTAIVDATRSKHSLHYTSTGRYGIEHVTIVADVGVAQGIQQITYSKAGKTGHVTVIVVARTGYVRGDAFALADYLGFNAAAAINYAGRWVRFPNDDIGYPAITAAVTVWSVADERKLVGKLSRVPNTTIHGESVLGVRSTRLSGGRRITDTIYARAKGVPLPVREVATEGRLTVIQVFSRWNERVDVAAPTDSVSIAVVRKSRPAGPIA